MEYYFISSKLSEHIYRIEDNYKDCCYLVVGTKRACLIDTLIGIGDLKSFVEGITTLPLTVILSHGHLDHLGGAGQFDNVYLREEDAEVAIHHTTLDFRVEIFINCLKRDYKPEDFMSVDTTRFLPMPEDWVLDLGGVTVENYHIPGHTRGTVCPLIPEDRILVIGDECDDNVLLDNNSVSVRTYMENLKKLDAISHRYDRMVGNHGSYEFSRDTLVNILDCCEKILSRTDAHFFYQLLDKKMFSSCALDENGARIDGKSGNVLYWDECIDG